VIAWGDNFLGDAKKLTRVSATIAAGSGGCDKPRHEFDSDGADGWA